MVCKVKLYLDVSWLKACRRNKRRQSPLLAALNQRMCPDVKLCLTQLPLTENRRR